MISEAIQEVHPVITAGARRGSSGLRPPSVLFKQGLWVLGGHGASSAIRLTSNLVLTRLLPPELFGIMVVVNSLRYGIELLADLGIEQNIISNGDGAKPEFANTAWTVQILRGLLLGLVFALLAGPFSVFYNIDRRVFLVISLAPFVNSLASTSVFSLVKNLDARARNMFEAKAEILSFIATVVVTCITRTVWALVCGALLSLGIRAAMSYRIPHMRHRLTLRSDYVRQIVRFGRWILISSIVVYAASNIDRMFLGRYAPLAMLGVYGIARTISELPATLASKLSSQIVFPLLAREEAGGRDAVKPQLESIRRKFVCASALCLATAVAWSDFGIRLLYDHRYIHAGWMLSALLLSSWISALASMNEALVLGLNRPAYNSVANLGRLAVMVAGVPVLYWVLGFPGAIAALTLSEVVRYLSVAVAQHKLRYSFWTQDLLATTMMFATIGLLVGTRLCFGLGTPWDLMWPASI
jgi:O-antigen/teichoic acid export membrane protein